MNKSLTYIKHTAVVLVALYVIFAGLLTASAVLSWATWTQVGDWLIKAAAVFAILLIINIIVSMLVNATRKQ